MNDPVPRTSLIGRGSGAAHGIVLDLRFAVDEDIEAVLPSLLTYHRSDPFAVRLACGIAARNPIVWIFARDLLVRGIRTPSGMGDVTVAPGGPEEDRVRITLGRGDGAAVLSAPAALLREFVEQTKRITPFGQEGRFLDLDRTVERLLSAATPTLRLADPDQIRRRRAPRAPGGHRPPHRPLRRPERRPPN